MNKPGMPKDRKARKSARLTRTSPELSDALFYETLRAYFEDERRQMLLIKKLAENLRLEEVT